MKKIAFTYGAFDCLNRDHLHLVNEMRKLVLPDNEILVVIPDDYPVFVETKCFPIQRLEHRKNNLSYLLKNIIVSYTADPAAIFRDIIAKAAGSRLVFVAYEDCKDFPGREVLKAHNIPVRFIKRYGTKKAQNN